MAGANSQLQITDLDFNTIKKNLTDFLKSQDTLKDYNYEGSALSVLLDVMAYNTQYNAFYLNMVANEMFLDSAIQRNSVVSQAKLLNYTPKSALAPEAKLNLIVNQVVDSSLTLPKFTTFMSEAIDGVNYNFVTTDETTVNVINNVATFSDITIKQGTPTSIAYTVDSISNPKFTFKIPNTNVDTTSLQVIVQTSTPTTHEDVYAPATDYLTLDKNSLVYFLQEGLNGFFEIFFGDDTLGKKLTDGDVVKISYILTEGVAAAGANNFVLMNSLSGYSNTAISPLSAATDGSARESISSIKFQAPKSYSAQNRAVSKEDYITAIQQNKLGYAFDAVSVWGGQENDPPVYGQVFVSLKPAGAFALTATQKTRLLQEVIRPISVLTVEPTIVDPDYTYVQINANVLYDPKKTSLTSGQIREQVKAAINSYASTSLNTFNSTFQSTSFSEAISAVSPAIITNELSIQLQKKFFPNLSTPTTYKFYYGAELKKGMFQSGINSSPSVSFRDPTNLTNTIAGIFIEEVPSSSGGVESISILNPGFGYQSSPTVTILGDGTGATAQATINANGTIKEITILTPGTGYTSAIATITPATNDTTGQLGAVIVNLEGRYGTLRTFYNNTQNVKTIFNPNIGTVDYKTGLVTLNSFGPLDVDNPLGQLTLSVNPITTIVSSSFSRIITVDPFDANAVVVNVRAKTA
jgi:hypothetical protein